jgi:hypothetical protein
MSAELISSLKAAKQIGPNSSAERAGESRQSNRVNVSGLTESAKINLYSPSTHFDVKLLERHGRTHTALSWMDSRRNVLFACGAFGYGFDNCLTRSAICSSSGSRYLNFGLPSYLTAFGSVALAASQYRSCRILN